MSERWDRQPHYTPPGNGREPRMGNTEQAVMRAFVARHAERLRYDHDRGKWLCWDHHHWRLDARKKAFFWALEYCHGLGMKKAEKVSFANAVETAARVMPPLATCAADYDPDPHLVATPAGVLDLQDGSLRPGRPEDMLDRALAVAPADGLPDLWIAFLDRMFGGDVEIIDFLQRWGGYCLGGDISEHKFVFLHGTGANGKGTLLNTMQAIWGDLCATASIDVFLETQIDRHPTELARLHGSHLVVVHETREGRRWDAARIKAMTGGDRITARFMRRDEFEFTPRFKPMFAGNHRPHLRSIDEAIRRRLLLLPCTVTIPAHERDPHLAQKLRAEHAQILGWFTEGYRLWRKIGLRPPQTVTDATNAYLANQDDLKLWLDERTQSGQGRGPTPAKTLFADWRTWKDARAEHPGSARGFNDRLRDAGFEAAIKREGVVFSGIQLGPIMY